MHGATSHRQLPLDQQLLLQKMVLSPFGLIMGKALGAEAWVSVTDTAEADVSSLEVFTISCFHSADFTGVSTRQRG